MNVGVTSTNLPLLNCPSHPSAGQEVTRSRRDNDRFLFENTRAAVQLRLLQRGHHGLRLTL